MAGFLVMEIFIRQFELDIRPLVKNYALFLFFLRNHSLTRYRMLVDLVVYDKPGELNRFTIIYYLLSEKFNSRLRVQVQVNEVVSVYSVSNFFKNANWLEREVWDFFGIFFIGHRDLRRILTDYGFSGHPLRKDFPLTGFTEIYYSDYYKRVIHCPTVLIQEYRNYSFETSWNY